MRSRKLILYCVFVVAILFGCLNTHNYSHFGNDNHVTKGYSKSVFHKEFYITHSDLQNYVKFRQLEGKSKGVEVVLTSISSIRFDTLPCLYVIQYREGFEIISADKRSPVPIAMNSQGTYTDCEDKDGLGGHLSLVASEIWLSLNDYLPVAQEEEQHRINSSLDFWKCISADSTRILKGNRGRIPNGFWEMVEVDSEEEVFDSIPHLTTTLWHQNSLYNYYCPEDKDTNNIIRRCPAGCVAIAGAQMLYYLHNKDGVPTTSPHSGYCTGYVFDNSYFHVFWNYSSATWDLMESPYVVDTCEALLIGDIGKRLNMDYSWDGSGAPVEDLVASVFAPYGWNSIFLDEYNSSIIVCSLQEGYPVVCAGYRINRGVDKIGHAFLVDRYKRTRTRTRVTWRWVSLEDDPGASTILLPPDDEFIYSSPHITYYGMNWGQGNLSANNTWCTLSGVWQYGALPPYCYNRSLIYGFSTIQN